MESITRDFIDCINDSISKKDRNRQKESSDTSLTEYLDCVSQTLKESQSFSEEEIEGVIDEITKGCNDSQSLALIHATNAQHLLAKQLGFPSLEFVHKLKRQTNLNRGEDSVTIKKYSVSLDSVFYQNVLESIPSLKFDFQANLYMRLSKEYSQQNIAPALSTVSKDLKNKTLLRIKRQTIKIAQLLAKQKPVTESLIEYSKREAFRQRDIPAKYITLLTSSKHKTAEKQQAAHLTYNVKNCRIDEL